MIRRRASMVAIARGWHNPGIRRADAYSFLHRNANILLMVVLCVVGRERHRNRISL